nr:hypothetical protein [Deltaproteobacteria bacterium]
TPPSPRCWWPEIPEELATTLLAMLSKDPTQRPALSEVIRVLRAAHSQLQAVPQPVPYMHSVVAMMKRNLLRVTVAVAVGVTGVATLLA